MNKITSIGYQFVCDHYKLSAAAIERPCKIAPVHKLTETPDSLLVPARTAPVVDDPIEHILFALKHEGTNLQILTRALTRIPALAIHQRICKSPTSRYVRLLGFLWEAFNNRQLEGSLGIAGPTIDVFDSKRYITAPGQRNTRWKVNFNGLGSIHYCVTVRRTTAINEGLELDILSQTRAFMDQLGTPETERALAWAYQSEAQTSFAIERESVPQDKAQTFVALLKQAHTPRPMSEDYLVELQNTAITNPFDLAASYRHQQNWLSGPLRGAAGITYVPPPPELVPDLMDGVLTFANELPKTIDPLVAATIASFGFVFVHPFMDGNGRLSRFLFHYALCQSGQLTNGLLLPVSIAMKRHELQYLRALQAFSLPVREQWHVRWIDQDNYDFEFTGDKATYQYWDATPMVEFSLDMAKQALDHDLKKEIQFLRQYDHIYRMIDQQFDVRGSDLTTLVISCLQNNGRVSNNRRKQFHLTVPAAVFDAIEQACAQLSPQND